VNTARDEYLDGAWRQYTAHQVKENTSCSEMFDRNAETRFDVIRDQLIAQNIRTMLASVEQQSERSI
jgi:hypothetical protein